jgi:hypothetical protein
MPGEGWYIHGSWSCGSPTGRSQVWRAIPRWAAKRSKAFTGSVAMPACGVWPDGLRKQTWPSPWPVIRTRWPPVAGGVVLGPADLFVHRCHHEPALVEFADDPAWVQLGDDIGLELVAVTGEVGELPVEQAGDAASGFFDVPAVVQAAVEEGEQARCVAVAGGQRHPQAGHAAQAGAPASVCLLVRSAAIWPVRVVGRPVPAVGDGRDEARRRVLGDPRDRVRSGHVRQQQGPLSLAARP